MCYSAWTIFNVIFCCDNMLQVSYFIYFLFSKTTNPSIGGLYVVGAVKMLQ